MLKEKPSADEKFPNVNLLKSAEGNRLEQTWVVCIDYDHRRGHRYRV